MVDVELDHSEKDAPGLTEHLDKPSIQMDQVPKLQKKSVKRRRRKIITIPPYKSSNKSTNKTKGNSGDMRHSRSISGQQEHTLGNPEDDAYF